MSLILVITITLRRLLLRRLCCVFGRLWVDFCGFRLGLSRLDTRLLLRCRVSGGSDGVPVLISSIARLANRGDVRCGLLVAYGTLDALRPI